MTHGPAPFSLRINGAFRLTKAFGEPHTEFKTKFCVHVNTLKYCHILTFNPHPCFILIQNSPSLEMSQKIIHVSPHTNYA